MLNIIKFYNDHGIQTEGNKSGWVNTTCPFCGDSGSHLGFEIREEYFHCWRCGHHPIPATLAKLSGMDIGTVRTLLKTYQIGKTRIQTAPKIQIKRRGFRIPSETGPLQEQHIRFLKKRGFSPEQLKEEWKIQGTGPVSTLDGISYKHRIFIPITRNGRTISFQTRDITNKSPLKYMACPKEREILDHKHTLYGLDEARLFSKSVIVVEGVTDVWRIGKGAVATFGTAYTIQQVKTLERYFENVYVLFDNEPQARKQGLKLRNELSLLKVKAYAIEGLLEPGEDPDNLIKSKVEELRNNIFNP